MALNYKPKVLLAILHQGWIRPELSNAIIKIISDNRVELTVIYTDLKPSENNRNFTCKKVLDESFDWLLTIDHDTVPLKNPIDLIFLGKDIIGFAYPQWNIADPKGKDVEFFRKVRDDIADKVKELIKNIGD